jgi:hypothetical protein
MEFYPDEMKFNSFQEIKLGTTFSSENKTTGEKKKWVITELCKKDGLFFTAIAKHIKEE